MNFFLVLNQILSPSCLHYSPLQFDVTLLVDLYFLHNVIKFVKNQGKHGLDLFGLECVGTDVMA